MAVPIIETVDSEPTSVRLQPLLLSVFEALESERDPSVVALALENLLLFLCSAEGRTHANCVATDRFFCLRDGWGNASWEHLPPALADVVSLAGEALHDTVASPEIAANFGCTPEQLLATLRSLGLVRHAV